MILCSVGEVRRVAVIEGPQETRVGSAVVGRGQGCQKALLSKLSNI
jgi:hypothetical protein